MLQAYFFEKANVNEKNDVIDVLEANFMMMKTDFAFLQASKKQYFTLENFLYMKKAFL